MTIFLTREFCRFARKANLAVDDLRSAAEEIVKGRWDVSLGHGVFKQRVARRGGGKSGGFRTIIVFKRGNHSFFVYGFAKNDKANVSTQHLTALKRLATVLLAFTAEELLSACDNGELVEVRSNGE